MNLIKSYEYPKRTDFIFIGEINTLASQYEVDLKADRCFDAKNNCFRIFELEFDS